MVKIRVLREACCAQDDQLGPLETTCELVANATLSDLASAIVGSRFLQYSSSHTSLVGYVGERAVVALFSSCYLPGRNPEFVVSPTELVSTVVGDRPIEFRFMPCV